MSFRESLERCNHTELYQICRDHDIAVSPARTRQELIEYILHEQLPNESDYNEVDTWRNGIMLFLLDHWEVVRAQLDCPAKSGDPKSCFNCIDATVLSCITGNAANEPLIQLKRRR